MIKQGHNREETNNPSQEYSPYSQLRYGKEKRCQQFQNADNTIEFPGIMPEAIGGSHGVVADQIDQSCEPKHGRKAISGKRFHLDDRHGTPVKVPFWSVET